jgi:hypothetical protein
MSESTVMPLTLKKADRRYFETWIRNYEML